MEFGILGPLQVLDGDEALVLGGARQRAVLARLLLDAGQVVTTGTLIEDVWCGQPPASAAKTLQKYISELRKVLGPAALVTRSGGYALDTTGHRVDAATFEGLMAAGDDDLALSLWRGDVLADLPEARFASGEQIRLAELRLVAIERRLDAGLARGEHARVAADVAPLAREHPLRERLCGLLMLSLYRSGRQVEALRAFDDHRRHLADEVGVEPADELRALEAAILGHDPSLVLDDAGPAPRPRGNLQTPLTSFVGRSHDRDTVHRTIPRARLVTLTGPGGVGKTRLATEAGADSRADHPGGVWFVDLAGVTDPALVSHHASVVLHVGRQPGDDDEETLVAALAHRPALLIIIDNCEHLLDGCAPFVDHLLRACPRVRVLATSRRPLGVDGEHVLPVAPLDTADAVELLAQRARASGADVDDLVDHGTLDEICRALDGLPLAIELAASQLRVLGPHELAARLDSRLAFQGRRFDVAERQRTLSDVVSWSRDLLPEATQRAFARLGVFAGAIPLRGAEAVCGDDALEHITTLVDHSLLTRVPGRASPTFRFLETVHLYARAELSRSGELHDAQRAHARYYEALAARARPHLYGPDERAWLDQLDDEQPNVHAALAWAQEHDHALALGMATTLFRYWDLRWQEDHAVGYLETLFARDDFDPPAILRAWARTVMALLVANNGDARRSAAWAQEAAAIFQGVGDERGLACALTAVASAYRNEGSLDAAETALDRALPIAQRLGDDEIVGRILLFQCFIASHRGEHRRAAAIAEQELAMWTELGNRRGMATALRHRADSSRYLGDLDAAVTYCEQSIAIWHEVGDPIAVAHVRTTLADVARVGGDIDGAEHLYGRALEELKSAGDRRCVASTYKNLGVVATARGDHDRGIALLVDAVRLRHELGDHAGFAECFEGLAASLAASSRYEEAAVLLAAARRRRVETGSVAPHDEAATIASIDAAASEALGAEQHRRARAMGARLDDDEVVAYAASLAPEMSPV